LTSTECIREQRKEDKPASARFAERETTFESAWGLRKKNIKIAAVDLAHQN
jgi:hypothetical protein